MRVAILDLGTNTFNLLIAEPDTNGFKILYNNKIGVKLGHGGIGENTIVPEAMERGYSAISEHIKTIQKHKASKIYAFGTSTLRTAKNAMVFVDHIKTRFNIKVDIISGDREAELICKGVKQTTHFGDKKYLILDIGGGSNEFIITDQNQIYWKESFPLGIARLNEKFHPSDPILTNEIEQAAIYFEKTLTSLFIATDKYQPTILVGASGSFDTFYQMISAMNNETTPQNLSNKIELSDFWDLHNKLIKSKHNERLQMKGLEPLRVEMIVMAIVFVGFVLKKINFQELWQSNYALKEGAMFEQLISEN